MASKRHMVELAVDLLCAVVVATVALAVATNLISTICKNATVYSTKNGNFQHIDFISYYMAGTLAGKDESTRHKAYDPAVQLAQYNQVIAPAAIHRPIFFNYPPYSFPLMRSFSWLPLRQAYLSWDTISVLFAAGALIFARRAAGAGNFFSSAVLVLLFVLSFAGADALIDGQTTFFAAGLIALSYVGLKTNNSVLAGVATGMLAVKPHYFLFMVIPLVVSAMRGRYGPLIFAAATFVALLLAGVLELGLEQTLNYPKIVLAGENVELCPMTFPERMVCLRGPASLFLSHELSMKVGLASFVTGLLAIFLLFKKAPGLEWAYALTIPVLLSFSPHMHVYDCALLAIPACLLLPSLRPSKIVGGSDLPSFKMMCLLLLVFPLASWLFMVLAPEIGKACLPATLQARFSVNDIACALLSFPLFLLNDLLILTLGLLAIMKAQVPARPLQ